MDASLVNNNPGAPCHLYLSLALSAN